MNRQRLTLILIFIILTLGILPASAQGIIVPVPGVDTNPAWLVIDYLRVDADINNQIATTNIDLQFTNTGEGLAEGTFIFPLPMGATVDNLVMYVDGQAIESKILPADEAREIYVETVRRLVDPALLEYVGSNALQASIFPIPSQESRRIEIRYSQVLEADNGLIQYVYPLNTAGTTARRIGQMTFNVTVDGDDVISNVYSPSHNIALDRIDDTAFQVGFIGNNVIPETDFELYYGLATEDINLNLLTYRESATEDGFFMMLVQPPLSVPQEQIVPKDVIIVLDQSGSMTGTKWEQAQDATRYILENLNPQDRFNVIPFSTGWWIYSEDLLDASEASLAADWVDSLYPDGGTNINGALTVALEMADAERPTNIIFLTDGLATEGVTESNAILANLDGVARNNARIFTFGVGDDVDTFLLDSIVRDHRGTGSYVRPNERIDEEVASLYNKISVPILTDVSITVDGVNTGFQYPNELSDLFAGEQVTIVGRYRESADDVTITITGMLNGDMQSYVYRNLDFPANAGGDSVFIPRLWATRRIGDLLNSIRLNGESEELIDSVVNLSIRYGIITPYTSFLIEEEDILSQQGRDRAMDDFAEEAESLATENTGGFAVGAADTSSRLQSADAPAPALYNSSGSLGDEADLDGEGNIDNRVNPLQVVNGKTFIRQGDVWTDTSFSPDNMDTTDVVFLSDEYFQLLEMHPELADFFAIGEQVIVVIDNVAYQVTAE